ncbi:bestrophin homolog [Trichonephila clavipes]|nr:bestrophin homolog [Trichonephila clavipes]
MRDHWSLHHDNASSHPALIVSELLAKVSVATLTQPPYGSELVSEDFFSFPRIKGTLKRLSPKEQTMVYYDLGDPRLQTPPNFYRRFRRFLSRHCGSCYELSEPPMNKPLGESYGRTEPVNFEQYDNPNHRKVSNYSLFGDNYFNLISRSGKRGSVASDSAHQGATEPMVPQPSTNTAGGLFKPTKRGSTISDPGNLGSNELNPLTLTIPNNNYNRRHRPSAIAAHVLTSVSETEQEESDPEPSPADTVKMALAFLDEDLGDIVTVKPNLE